MIDTHDCILNGNTITIEPAIKSECDCSNVKLTLSTVCRHACNDDKVHVKVDFDDVTNKPYALTYVDNMYKMLEDLGMDDLSGFVTNDELSGIGYALQSDVEKRINDVVEVVERDYPNRNYYQEIHQAWNFQDGIYEYGENLGSRYVRRNEMSEYPNRNYDIDIYSAWNFQGGIREFGQNLSDRYMSIDEMSAYPNRNNVENIHQEWNFWNGIREYGNTLSERYARKNEIPSLEGYAKTTDIPDTSNFATKDEIVTEFKTINGHEITGTGNIEIIGGSGETIDTSNFARTDTGNHFKGYNIFEIISENPNDPCVEFNGRTTFRDEVNIAIDGIQKEDISDGIKCDMKQTKGQVATLYTGRILAPRNGTNSHSQNVINFGVNNNMKFVDGDGLYIQGEKLTDTYARKDEIPSLEGYVTGDNLINEINDVTDFISETYARKDEIPSLEGYAKTTDIPDTSNFAAKDDVNALSNNITNNYALKDEIPDTSNLATKDEIVTEFKTINGQEITGTGNIEIKTDIDTTNLFWVGTQEEYNALSDYTTYEFYMIKRA